MIVATAGHVDHGKTLLVRALTGVDTDRLPEERARGMTIDLGFAYRDLGDGTPTGFVDVPGHERFVRTMVAGVSGIDVVLFVIAADDGPMPQTAEHLAILDLLGVDNGVVALSKCDRASPERIAEVRAAIAALLAPTALAGTPVVEVSALTGSGIETLRAALLAAAGRPRVRDHDGNFRLAVDRRFTLKGTGRVVTGTVFSGAIAVGDVVWHTPGGGEFRVRGLHAQNDAALRAVAGQRCALNLVGSGGRDGDVGRGDWLVAAPAHFETRRFDAELRLAAGNGRALANRTPVHVHTGAADVTGRIVTLEGAAIAPGETARVQVLLDHALHVVRGDGVVLRDQSARLTLAGGRVLDPQPETRARNRVARLAHLDALAAATPEASLAAALAIEGTLDMAAFARAWNLAPATVDALVATSALVRYGDGRVATAARWQALADDLLAALARCHAAQPAAAGATLPALLGELGARPERSLGQAALEALVGGGQVVREGGLLRLPGHQPRRDPRDEALWRRVRRELEQAGGKAPVIHDLHKSLGVAVTELERFMARAAQAGWAVRVSPRRYLLPDVVEGYTALVRRLGESRPAGFSAAEFRDAAGIGRNTVIELLEYFDRIGLTRRQGDLRIVMRKS